MSTETQEQDSQFVTYRVSVHLELLVPIGKAPPSEGEVENCVVHELGHLSEIAGCAIELIL
jgi:hypothetical protein